MHPFIHALGHDNSNNAWYLFWSGIGSYMTIVIGGIIGFVKLYKQRDKHHRQLKDHIDYKFKKLEDIK